MKTLERERLRLSRKKRIKTKGAKAKKSASVDGVS